MGAKNRHSCATLRIEWLNVATLCHQYPFQVSAQRFLHCNAFILCWPTARDKSVNYAELERPLVLETPPAHPSILLPHSIPSLYQTLPSSHYTLPLSTQSVFGCSFRLLILPICLALNQSCLSLSPSCSLSRSNPSLWLRRFLVLCLSDIWQSVSVKSSICT